MTLLVWPPDILPTAYATRLVANTQSGGRSPFDGTEQTLAQPGARWAARLTFQGLDAGEHRHLAAFVAGQLGRAGRFYWSPPSQPARGGALAVALAPKIRLANMSGTLVATKGWQPNVGVFAPGDWLSWKDATGRDQLHMVTTRSDGQMLVAGSNASGWCDFNVTPPLRRPPPLDADINVGGPGGVFRLSRDENPFDHGQGMFTDATLEIEEAIW